MRTLGRLAKAQADAGRRPSQLGFQASYSFSNGSFSGFFFMVFPRLHFSTMVKYPIFDILSRYHIVGQVLTETYWLAPTMTVQV
jgi:hypothetical protein